MNDQPAEDTAADNYEFGACGCTAMGDYPADEVLCGHNDMDRLCGRRAPTARRPAVIRFDPPAEPTATGNVRVWTGEAVDAYAAGRRDERERLKASGYEYLNALELGDQFSAVARTIAAVLFDAEDQL